VFIGKTKVLISGIGGGETKISGKLRYQAELVAEQCHCYV